MRDVATRQLPRVKHLQVAHGDVST